MGKFVCWNLLERFFLSCRQYFYNQDGLYLRVVSTCMRIVHNNEKSTFCNVIILIHWLKLRISASSCYVKNSYKKVHCMTSKPNWYLQSLKVQLVPRPWVLTFVPLVYFDCKALYWQITFVVIIFVKWYWITGWSLQ